MDKEQKDTRNHTISTKDLLNSIKTNMKTNEMDIIKKYIEEHTQIQELISMYLNKSKFLGINKYAKWGPNTNIVAVLKIICIGDVEKDSITIVGILLIPKPILSVYVAEKITTKELKDNKYRLCIVQKYDYVEQMKNKIKLVDFYLIKNAKELNKNDISVTLNFEAAATVCWRDIGDGLLLNMHYSTEINKLMNQLTNLNEIEIDEKKLIMPARG